MKKLTEKLKHLLNKRSEIAIQKLQMANLKPVSIGKGYKSSFLNALHPFKKTGYKKKREQPILKYLKVSH